MTNRILITVCFFSLLQCTSDEGPVFSGITETNQYNEVVGKVDETDWKINEKWSKDVVNLFSDANISDINNSSIASIDEEIQTTLTELDLCFVNGRTKSVCSEVAIIRSAYPNPSVNHVSLGFNIDNEVIKNFKMVIVNQSLKPLISVSEFSGNYNFEISSSSSLKPGHTYRVYYLIQTTVSEFVFKGHGDIMTK